MTEEEIQKLLDEASGHYNDGSYDEAIALWRSILAADPGNERAAEGIKMANLLTSDWEPSGEETGSSAERGAGELDPQLLLRIEESVRRVDALVAAGDLATAHEGAEALEQIAPGHPGVQACAARVAAAENPSEFVDEQLAMARHYLMMGETEEAATIARKVLAVDPANAEAQGMLASAGAEINPSPVALPEPEMLPLSLELEEELEPLPLDVPLEPAGSDDGGIGALLAEGDQLQAEGKLDEAINAWSRVFIIHDTNVDAEQRIDAARRALEERAREMEVHLLRAGDLQKEGRIEEARAKLQRVLELRPGHAEALEMLDQLQAQVDIGDDDLDPIPLDPRPGPGAVPPPVLKIPSTAAADLAHGAARTPTPPPKPPARPPRAPVAAPSRAAGSS